MHYLAETDITASTADEIVSSALNHDDARHFNLHLERGRVKESLQRGRHIIQVLDGKLGVVQVVRELTGDNSDKVIEVFLSLYQRGATKAYIHYVTKTLYVLATRC